MGKGWDKRTAIGAKSLEYIKKVQKLKPILDSERKVVERALYFYLAYLEKGKPDPIHMMREALEELETKR